MTRVSLDPNLPWWPVCAADALEEGGSGHRFQAHLRGEAWPAFVVRVDGLVRSFLNRCAHVPVELDWNPGQFLDDSGMVIFCATHGAAYDATDGQCIGGPCGGRGLVVLACREHEGQVEVQAEAVEHES